MPPDPGNAELGREILEAEPLELEKIELDEPVGGETFKKDLDTLKADIPTDQQQAPAGTTTVPAADTESFTFGSAVSPASFTAATTATATAEGGLTQIPNLPVLAGQADGHPAPTGTWQFSVVDRGSEIVQGIEEVLKVGALVAVQAPSTGSVPLSVGIDYSGFKNLHGADWASRLRLVQFPECYLTTPLEPACQEYEELETVNDPVTDTVTATVDTAADGTATPAFLAAPAPTSGSGIVQAAYTTATTATPVATGGDKAVIGAVDSGAGPGGSFKATPLAASGKWTAGGSSGGFTYSYPMAMPPAPAGPAPNVTLSYNSQAVDGKTAVSSPQASWVGEGWDYSPGFIERRYRSCKDDTHALTAGTPNNTAKADKTGDLCWVSYNAVMSLGGSTTELVRVPTSTPETGTETYRPQRDDGTRVQRHVGGTNGDDNGEYWTVTTTDGTKYHFGLNKVGGTHADTNSVSTVPVFGNHPGEPCHATTFAASRCGTGKQQAWRWGLDKVEDVHGNVMIVSWKQETNHYAVRGKRATPEAYERAAYPTTIEYGLRATDLTKPSATVVFGVDQRCLKSTTLCNPANFKPGDPTAYRPWWDTPGSLNCASGSDLCPGFPSFWTQVRLKTVTTNAARAGQTGLGKVDSYTLKHSFPEDWYDTAPGLWLNSITRTGYGPGDTTGTLQSKDGVSFGHYTVKPRSDKALRKYLLDKQLPNLVSSGPGDKRPGFTRPRIGTVVTEAGADIEVEYIGGCQYEPTTDKGKANGTCYPVRWSPDGEEKTPAKAWFNKYVVASVTETDKVTPFGKPVTTAYRYSGPAWAKSDDEFLRPALRTYSDWRGYRQVAVIKGNKTSSLSQSLSVTRYFQGIGGEVKDSVDGTVLLADDAPQYAGMTAETLTYRDSSKTHTQFASRTRTFPDVSVETASRSRQAEDGTTLPALRAYRTAVKKTDSIQADGANWRGVRATTLDRDATYGLPTAVETAVVTHNGTGEVLSEQTCTKTSYVHNTTAWLIGLPSAVRTTATTCANHTGADSATELKGSVRTRYDQLAHGATPAKGLVTAVDQIDGTGTTHSITTSTTHDALGRVTSVIAPGTGETKTEYTPATGGPVTSVKTINAKNHTTTTTFDPGRALPLTVTDPNGRVTRTQYDALGRLVKGWSPSRSSGSQSASVEIAYRTATVAADGKTSPAAVTVKTLKDDGGYARQVTLYDGLLRQVQTQSEAHGPGRIVTDTYYNDHGLVVEQTSGYLAKGEPTTDLFKVTSPTHVKSRVKTVYDGMERPVRQTPYHGKTPRAGTTITYGDTATLVDPPGSSVPATTTVTDALGRVIELRHHVAPGKYRSTKYSYDKRGNRDKVTDPAGNTWTYLHDARGRVTSVKDPDTGITQTEYDNADRPNIVSDALGQYTYTDYDVLGRITAVREGSKLNTPVKEYTYDPTGALGLPAESRRRTTTGDYVTKVTGYDTEYRPTGRQVIIPANAMTTGLSGTYTYTYTYTPTGKPLSVTLPAKGGLPAEKVITRYNEDGLPESTSGIAWYTSDVSYSPYGEVLRSVSSAQPYRVWTTNFIDEHTGRLMRTVTDREKAGPHRISDTGYAYDAAGMITASARQDAVTNTSTTWDNQCFTYDAMGELVHAWTSNIKPNGTGVGCKSNSGATWGYNSTGAPSSGPVVDAAHAANTAPTNLSNAKPEAGTVASGTAVTGSAAYHQSFTYDWIGNRATMTDHDPAGVTANDINYTYKYSTTQPHTLTSVTSPTSLMTSYYNYNPTGTTAFRNPPGYAANQTLEWTPEHKLASNTVGTTKHTYVYDAEGNRILESSPTGSTLYLGETELTTDSVGLITHASRAYSQAGTPTVVRTTTNQSTTGHTLNVLLADHLGTAHTTVEAGGTQPVTRRSFKPYGETRGTKPANWPNKRSYLGVGIDDKATLLTHIGAREYDQHTGRFLSADPLIDITDPLQMNGYTYANGNPVSKSDPTGLKLDDGSGGKGETFYKDAEWGTWDGTMLDATIQAYEEAVRAYSHIGKKLRVYTNSREEIIKAQAKWDPSNGSVVDQISFKMWVTGASEREVEYFRSHYCDVITCHLDPLDAALAGRHVDSEIYDMPGGEAIGRAFADGMASRVGSGNPCGRNSFVAGTQVVLADGSSKPIEEVEIGDQVLAGDPGAGESVAKTVIATILTSDDKIYVDIVVESEGESRPLSTTGHHPFWAESERSWLNADELRPGMTLLAADGARVTVASVRTYETYQDTYNLTVADLHTYYVLAGETPVLVHNSGPGCGSIWIDSNKVPHHFKHAEDFGITGKESKATKQAFVNALESFVRNPGNVQVTGTYRGAAARHYVDPNTGRHVSVDLESGQMLGAWRSDPTSDQFRYLMEQGKL
ncbi:polymorphic toxin-type HINT domain-containing protein [Streptomyces sp. CC208A]|uniref:polymorphic toxin-type HINT domain-containing protein n=1 Tax=Streptomyces sp. CC208A TaxID=3044573 RepID=UPI0024A7A694|nr:polymorphic toxin-type HINT domain-containing protein [Streptomyces sp. CC208A]